MAPERSKPGVDWNSISITNKQTILPISVESDARRKFFGYSLDIPRIFRGYYEDIPRIFRGYSEDILRIF